MEETKSSIKKLIEDTLEDAIGSGMEVLHHLHSIMLIMATDIHRIRVQKEISTSHPQAVFSIIDNGDENLILYKKDWRERMMGSKKRKRTCTGFLLNSFPQVLFLCLPSSHFFPKLLPLSLEWFCKHSTIYALRVDIPFL